MKKMYFSPEIEIIRLNMKQSILTGSEVDDITDGPVPEVTPDPDDDGEW